MTWIMTAAAMLLTFGRYLIRFRTQAKFFWDDAAHALALVTLIAVVSLFTAFFPQIYLLDDVARGKARQPSASAYLPELKLRVAVSVCWWVSVYAVKTSFLLLYRMLFVVSKALNVMWWSITAFTMVTFWVCIAGELTTCGTSKNLLKEGRLMYSHYAEPEANRRQAHCESQAGLKEYITAIEYSGVVHVLSDLLSISLLSSFCFTQTTYQARSNGFSTVRPQRSPNENQTEVGPSKRLLSCYPRRHIRHSSDRIFCQVGKRRSSRRLHCRVGHPRNYYCRHSFLPSNLPRNLYAKKAKRTQKDQRYLLEYHRSRTAFSKDAAFSWVSGRWKCNKQRSNEDEENLSWAQRWHVLDPRCRLCRWERPAAARAGTHRI